MDESDIPEALRPFLVDDPVNWEAEIHAQAHRLEVAEATVEEWLATLTIEMGDRRLAWRFLNQELACDRCRIT